MRVKLKKYHNKTITIYGYFQCFGGAKYFWSKDEQGNKIREGSGPTICLASITKNLVKPLCDHAWISGKDDYKVLKKMKVSRGNLIKMKVTVVKYNHKENYTFRGIQSAEKVDNKFIKIYYKVLIKLLQGII